MKIGPTTAGIQADAAAAAHAPAARAADATPAQAATPGAVGAGADGDRLELSSTAATLLAGGAGSSADFDAAKVERISRAIADGSFKINAEAIADRLIANAEELLSGSRPGPAG